MSRIFLSSIPLEALSKVKPFASNFRFLNMLCYRCNMVNYGHCFFRSLKRSFDLPIFDVIRYSNPLTFFIMRWYAFARCLTNINIPA
jgi:hypothetical protein